MFKSPEAALAFAFRLRTRSVINIPSIINIANRVDTPRNMDRLTQYDLHAQAGMIFSFLTRRPDVEQAYAFYLYGTEKERRLAAAIIAESCKERLSRYSLSSTKMRRAVQARNIRAVALDAGLTNYKAWKFRQDLADALQPVRDSLMDSLWERLNQP